jgi:hypothetical protein
MSLNVQGFGFQFFDGMVRERTLTSFIARELKGYDREHLKNLKPWGTKYRV